MKHLRSTFFISIALLVMLVACAPQATPTPVVVVVTATMAPTDTPTAVPAATDTPAATATLVPVSLLPPMQVGSTFTYVDDSLLVAVPGGQFTVGRTGGTDNPLRQISVPDFWIYRAKVTNQEYSWCVALGQCTPPDMNDNKTYQDPTHVNDPVVGVRWDQAQAYCTFVHGRLPTEFEWEKVASWDPANSQKHLYPWGEGAPSCDLLNYNNCVGSTTNVVRYPQGKSFYNALDMEGNSFEWTGNWYDALYYRTMPADNPQGPNSGTQRSVRSTGFKSSNDQVPTTVRFYDYPDHHRRDLGFRCVVEDPSYFAPLCQTSVVYGGGPGAPGNQTGGQSLACPSPVIHHNGADCATGRIPQENVWVTLDPPSTIVSITGLETCNPPSPGLNVHTVCPVGVDVHASATCQLQPPGDPGCPPGYNLVTDANGKRSCVSKGGPGQCPTSYSYDTTNMCCSAVPGSNASVPPCNPGFHYYNGSCVPDSSNLFPPTDADSGPLPVENPCPGPSGGGCTPSPSNNNCQQGGGCGKYPNCGPNCHAVYTYGGTMACVPN